MSVLSKIPAVASTAIQVVVGPKGSPLTEAQRRRAERAMPRLERLALVLDDGFTLPYLGWKIGLDPLIGLLPYGDLLTSGASVYMLVEAVRMGAPTSLMIRLIGRTATHLLIELIPVIGDILDFYLRTHRGNVRDLQRWLKKALAEPPLADFDTATAAVHG